MMRINKQQWQQLDDRLHAVFIQRLTWYLRREYPPLVAALDDDELKQRVTSAVRQAEVLGLTWQNMIATYVVAVFLVGSGFASDPVIEAVLDKQEGSMDERFASLSWRLLEHDWQAVVDRQQMTAEPVSRPNPGRG